MSSVAVMGASGRMGQEVIQLLHESKTLHFGGGVAQGTKEFFSDVSALPKDDLKAVIDFSLPEGFFAILNWCMQNKVPLVSGTTGLDDKSLKLIESAGQQIPILWSPNMSLGVAFVNKLLAEYRSISHFDFAIDEVHHNKKKDSPSGTALLLQKQLENSIGKPVTSMNAIRGGGVFGIHKVWALSPDEVITLEHSALNRSVFAAGALKATEWLIGQKPGCYSLVDVLAGR